MSARVLDPEDLAPAHLDHPFGLLHAEHPVERIAHEVMRVFVLLSRAAGQEQAPAPRGILAQGLPFLLRQAPHLRQNHHPEILQALELGIQNLSIRDVGRLQNPLHGQHAMMPVEEVVSQ